MKKTIRILKKKFKNYNPKIKEECGVFGISNNEDASTLTALGLHALQHRGQEGCGIVSFDGKKYHSCLLYTSPSPRDPSISRMPSSA